MPDDNVEQGERTEIPTGYITKEEWIAKGRDEADWRDPEEWKERGDTILPIVKKERDELRAKEKKHDEAIAELQGDLKRINAFNERQEASAIKKERQRIEDKYELKRKEAFEENDYEAIQKADTDKAKELETVEVSEETKPNIKSTEVFNEWKDRNTWYTDDKELQEFADTEGADLMTLKMQRGMPQKEALDYVTDFVKREKSDKFVNARSKQGFSF